MKLKKWRTNIIDRTIDTVFVMQRLIMKKVVEKANIANVEKLHQRGEIAGHLNETDSEKKRIKLKKDVERVQ